MFVYTKCYRLQRFDWIEPFAYKKIDLNLRMHRSFLSVTSEVSLQLFESLEIVNQ